MPDDLGRPRRLLAGALRRFDGTISLQWGASMAQVSGHMRVVHAIRQTCPMPFDLRHVVCSFIGGHAILILLVHHQTPSTCLILVGPWRPSEHVSDTNTRHWAGVPWKRRSGSGAARWGC